MNNTWILIAHRGGARLFDAPGPGQGLHLLESVTNPAGRLKNRQIDSDKPGRAFDKFGGGRHAMSTEQAPTDRVAQRFAKELGERLSSGRLEHRFARLMIVAEPRFLGELRDQLDPPTTAMIAATLDKDLGSVADRELPDHLGGILRL